LGYWNFVDWNLAPLHLVQNPMDFDWVDKKAFELVAVQETIKGISLSLNKKM
jgi:hypothetical protein